MNNSFSFTIRLVFPSKIFLKNFVKKQKKNNNILTKKLFFQILKNKKKQFVFLKSPHVNKKAKEHFCFLKYILIFNIVCTLKNLLKIIKLFPFFINFYIFFYNKNKDKLKKRKNI
jgi:hypothetical protein